MLAKIKLIKLFYLVGGMTRIPKVVEIVKNIFGQRLNCGSRSCYSRMCIERIYEGSFIIGCDSSIIRY